MPGFWLLWDYACISNVMSRGQHSTSLLHLPDLDILSSSCSQRLGDGGVNVNVRFVAQNFASHVSLLDCCPLHKEAVLIKLASSPCLEYKH